MSRRPAKALVRRARADQDVAEIIDHYLAESPAAAIGFVDALEAAYRHIERWPETGSPRYAHALALPGLRFWGCVKYPYLVFYMCRTECTEALARVAFEPRHPALAARRRRLGRDRRLKHRLGGARRRRAQRTAAI